MRGNVEQLDDMLFSCNETRIHTMNVKGVNTIAIQIFVKAI